MASIEPTWGHIERGEKNVSFMSIVRVADALNVELAELFAGLETGGQLSRGRKRKESISRLDRHRILREVLALKRATRNLKELAEQQPPVLAPQQRNPRGRKRKGA